MAGIVLASTIAAGCGSSGSDGGGGGGGGGGSNDPGGGGNNDPTLLPELESIQQNVFTPDCTACHSGAAAPWGLRLDSANSYGLLVGVPSGEVPSLLRVDPGNPDESYLIQKLEGTAAVGEQMPLGGPPLSQADIDVIRQWITDGALPTGQPPPSGPVRVTSLSPLPDSTIVEMPTSIIAIFDRELDAGSVSADTFTLTRSGGDGTFTDGNEVAVAAASVEVPLQNPTTAVLDLSGLTPLEDTYRVLLVGDGQLMIQDLEGNALDGEFDGTFPSGDGTGGGDFIAEFTVEGVQPTLESIQTNVFTPICSACHTGPAGGAPPEGLPLTNADASFDNLVGIASFQMPGLQRVEPGDPDASYLVQKIEGTAGFGVQMPAGLPPLDDATIAAIREWIALGAER